MPYFFAPSSSSRPSVESLIRFVFYRVSLSRRADPESRPPVPPPKGYTVYRTWTKVSVLSINGLRRQTSAAGSGDERGIGLKPIVVSVLLAACAHGQTQASHYSLLDNLNEKLADQNLADSVVLGTPTKKYVPIVSGAEFLLNYLESDPQYKRDRIWGRLAHTHPISTIAYREEDNPSTHVVFLKLPDGSLKADMHLDGNGPQKVFPHLDEFFFHKLTFQDNNQDRMNANLKRSLFREAKGPQEVFISKRERTLLYIHETLGLEPIASAFGITMFRHYAHEFIWKTEPRYEPMLNRFEESLFRNTIKHSIEFGVANWRQEDTRYKPSGQQGARPRLRYALIHAFVVPTPTGTEFAYARFTAIVGTAAATDAWHPWREPSYHPNYYRQTTFGLALDPVAKSMWAEFGPDVKHRFRVHQ